MVQRVFDYLTLSCLTTKCISVEQCLEKVLDTLRLTSLWNAKKFDFVGRSRFYALIYRFNDISIKLPEPERLAKQGICVEISGNGLAYYQAYLLENGLTLRHVLKAWRALSVGGIFTRATRWDYALDDISRDGEDFLLSMKRINGCVRKHEFRSRIAVQNPIKRIVVDFNDVSKNNEELGHTVYFGNRKSVVFVRFYDKLLEQKHKKVEVDGHITSWVRCELEFKQARAMAVYNAYCDMTDDEFSAYMSGVVNNYISFINKDDANISRCSLKKWWADFLGGSDKSRLSIPPYRPSSFGGTAGWLRRSVFPTLCRYIFCIGLPAFLRQLQQAFRDLENSKETFRHRQMMEDFKTVISKKNISVVKPDKKDAYDLWRERVKLLGLDPWIFTSNCPEKAMEKLEEEYNRYCLRNGSEWSFARSDEAAEISLQYSFDDFPPESIFGADFDGSYYDGIDDLYDPLADVDDDIIEAFCGGC